ncbi:MAG: anaerobic sulfatase maturase [Clostridia bacterium]|nr:anaerobic sulfatase maturase [Clostridia bacterium]
MKAISVLMKPSSGMCNMHCDYCFYCDEQVKRDQANYGFMSEETLRTVIRRTLTQAEEMAGFAFQGGEPTLRGLDFFKKLMEYEKRCNRHQVRIQNSLQTNGALIDEDWCRFLKENHFLVGLSIDGLQPIHDKHRRLNGSDESAYERVCKAADMLDRFGVDYNILTVVHADVAERIEEIYGAYQKRGWHYQQYIACLDPLGEAHGKSPYALTPEVYGDFLIRLFECWYRDVQRGRQPYIRQFENIIGILLGYPPEACDQRGTCSLHYVVEADGSVYPCDFYMLDEYRLGNFNSDHLPALDAKRKEIGFVERSRMLSASCRECPYFRLCRGGCQRNRDLDPQSGEYRNYFCESYRAFFAKCLPRIENIAGQYAARRVSRPHG